MIRIRKHLDSAKPTSDAAGNFVVARIDYQSGGAASYEIRARRFNSSGVAQGGDILVNTYTTGVQGRPAVAMSSTAAATTARRTPSRARRWRCSC